MENSAKISVYSGDVITYNHIRYQNCNSTTFGAQAHDVWEMIFLKEGDLNYIIEGSGYRVKPYSLILTRPGYMHYLQFNDCAIYDRYDILFDAKILLPDLYKKIPSDLHVISFEKPEEMLRNFEKMDYYYTHFEGELMGNMLHHLIEETLCNVIISDRLFEFKKEDVFMRNEVLIKAIEYIKENLESDFSLDELCQELYITKGYLHKLFKQILDISPKKYIISKRLAKAQRAIRHKKKPTEVYAECGFTDYSAFYRNYKKFYGYSPSDELNVKKIREIKS